MNKINKPIFKVIYTLIISGALLIWLMQDSINAYWTLTYHQQSPLVNLSHYKFWQLGSKIHQDLLEAINKPRWKILDKSLSVKVTTSEATNEDNQDNNNVSSNEKAIIKTDSALTTATPPIQDIGNKKDITKTKLLLPSPLWAPKLPLTDCNPSSVTAPIANIEKTKKAIKKVEQPTELAKGKKQTIEKKDETKQITKRPKATPKTVVINKKQMVFFAGDSMMQGVAPHVRVALRKKYGIRSIDLSKQSTGLTYASFFDWPKTVKKTLQKHKDIGLLVMFLGPNDPWNMPNPKGGKYLKFQSSAWEKVYRDKIRYILELAKKHKVQVIWLGVPDMRKEKLNQGVRYLNTLYQSEIKKAGDIYLPTQFLLTGKTAGYSKYAMTDSHKKVAVRTNDGIHFTVTGQKKIAHQILSKITIKED